jgi:hypothetical protein
MVGHLHVHWRQGQEVPLSRMIGQSQVAETCGMSAAPYLTKMIHNVSFVLQENLEVSTHFTTQFTALGTFECEAQTTL